MCKEYKSSQIPRIEVIIISIIIMFLALPAVYGASNSTNGTGFEQTTSTWTERANLSITTTSTGWVLIQGTFDARVNRSGENALARIKKDGVVISQANLTEVASQANSIILGASYVTAGTYYYAVDTSMSNGWKLIVTNWTFLVTDNSGTGTGGAGNVSSVLCSPAGTLDCTGTDIISVVLDPTGTNFRNDTIETQGTSITELQGNDSTDRSYVNLTFLPIGTYNGDYPNSTIAGYSGNFPNSSLSSYLLIATYNGDYPNSSIVGIASSISTLQTNDTALQANDTTDRAYVNATFLPILTYNGNFPNSSLASYLPIATYSGNFPNSTLAGYSGDFPNSTLGNYLLISTYSGNFPNSTISGYNTTIAELRGNDTTDRAYVNTTFLPILTYNGNYPNSSLSNYLLIATYNGNYPNSTVASSVNCSALGTTYYSYWNGSAYLCRQDQTSAFQIRENSGSWISGFTTLISGTGITMSSSGTNITINSPAAGVTNATVDPHSMNSSNLTGTIAQARLPSIPEANLTLNYATHDESHTLNSSWHTGDLNWNRLMSILVNLSATSNITGQLGTQYLENYTTLNATINGKLDTIGCSGALTCEETPDNTVTATFQQDSLFGIPLYNGVDALETGYYEINGRTSAGTITEFGLISRYGTEINVSFLYNDTGIATYPQDVVAVINGADADQTGLSISMIDNGYYEIYINNNTGEVNVTTLNGKIRRV